MDQFREDFEKEMNEKAIISCKPMHLTAGQYDMEKFIVQRYNIKYVEYLENRLKDEQEKVKQLSEMVLKKR